MTSGSALMLVFARVECLRLISHGFPSLWESLTLADSLILDDFNTEGEVFSSSVLST